MVFFSSRRRAPHSIHDAPWVPPNVDTLISKALKPEWKSSWWRLYSDAVRLLREPLGSLPALDDEKTVSLKEGDVDGLEMIATPGSCSSSPSPSLRGPRSSSRYGIGIGIGIGVGVGVGVNDSRPPLTTTTIPPTSPSFEPPSNSSLAVYNAVKTWAEAAGASAQERRDLFYAHHDDEAAAVRGYNRYAETMWRLCEMWELEDEETRWIKRGKGGWWRTKTCTW